MWQLPKKEIKANTLVKKKKKQFRDVKENSLRFLDEYCDTNKESVEDAISYIADEKRSHLNKDIYDNKKTEKKEKKLKDNTVKPIIIKMIKEKGFFRSFWRNALL